MLVDFGRFSGKVWLIYFDLWGFWWILVDIRGLSGDFGGFWWMFVDFGGFLLILMDIR